jgi:bifunctional non-homologous end joining protein LigD
VCLDGGGKSRFDELLFRYGVPYYYAFDLVWLNGKDLRRLPLIERNDRLKEILAEASSPALLYATSSSMEPTSLR